MRISRHIVKHCSDLLICLRSYKNVKFICLTSICLCALNAQAQFNQAGLINPRPDSLETGTLYFNFYNFNYVRNYEYFNAFQDGFTLYGAQFEPQLVYEAHPNLTISAGAYLRKDFGRRAFYDAKPIFSLKYHKNDLTLVFGTLEGNIQHRYIEPLFDMDRKITNPIEYGTQLLIEKKRLFLDAWIAWERMIYKPSPVQEQIAGGLSAEVTAADKDGWKLSFPAQFIARHQGGQIDVGATQPLSTLFNGAAGFKLQKNFQPGAFKSIFTENYIAVYKDFSPHKQLPYQAGSGIWLNAGLNTSFGTIITSYWRGNGFMALKGTPIYQSVSQQINYPGHTEKKRELLLFRYAYQHELLPKLYLDVRIEPVFDLSSPFSKQMDFSNSFFLTYRENFRIGKIKKD